MYGPDDVIPVVRSDAEWEDMHPVYRAYAENPVGRSFARDHVRAEVIPSYMGLIKQCDDQMGVLFDWRQGGDLLSRTRLIAATAGNVVETLWGRDAEFGGAHPGIKDSGISYTDDNGVTKTDGIIGDGVREVFDASGNVIGYTENDVIVAANAYHNNRYRRQNETEGMYDATFIKLREAKLTYSLPKKWLNKTKLGSLSVSVIGTNLWLWAKDFNHGDPELLSFGGGRYVPGVENATVPTTRSLGFAVNVGF